MTNAAGLQAAIFDLDGVITFTARVHAAAWKEAFDGFLRKRAGETGQEFIPFDPLDYRRYVDGKPRIDGVTTFLAARSIVLPLGSSSDPAGLRTAWALGNRKNELFQKKLEQMGVDVDEDAVRIVRELRLRGLLIGLASSSKNTPLILRKSRLGHLFDAVVDGNVSEQLGLKGKPEPDIFLHCLRELSSKITPQKAALVEDAISGVEAGRRGGFGLVLGVDRQQTGTLKSHGADRVISDFHRFTADQLIAAFDSRGRAA
jgi:HAD superfamily hydrolase (TIGR01509 family)